VLLESHAHAIADFYRIDRGPHDIGRYINSRCAIDGDPRDDIRNLQTLPPWLVVDREGIDDTRAGYGLRGDILREAASTHRAGWMNECATLPAAQELQLATSAGGPKETVVLVQPGQCA
jgi:hypothetical protein